MTAARIARLLAIPAAVALLAITACTPGTASEPADGGSAGGEQSTAATDLANPDARVTGPITVGYLPFASSRMMAEVYVKALKEAGYVAQLTVPAGNEDLLPAMAAGKVDIVPEFAGPLAQELAREASGPDAPEPTAADINSALAEARDLAAPLGITVLDPTPGAESAQFAVSTDFSQATGITTLSQLAEWSKANPLRMGGDATCEVRSFCKPNLEKTYGLVVKDFVKLSSDGVVVRSGLLNAGFELGYLTGTDAEVGNPDLTVLEQDIPLDIVGNVVPAVRTDIATPELVAALNDVSATVSDDELGALVRALVVDGVPAGKAAGDYIAAQGFGEGLYAGPTKVVSVEVPKDVPVPATTSEAGGPLRISYAPLTDLEIAARVYAGALVKSGIPVAIDGPTESADLFGEVTAGVVQFAPVRLNALVNTLNTEANGMLALPIEGRDVNKMVAQSRELGEAFGIEVLNASTANVSNAWVVNNNFVANTGITTLSALANASQNRPVILGGPPTCAEDRWCQPFLQDAYGIKFENLEPLDFGGGLTRSAIDGGAVDVGWLGGNDGGIEEFGFVVLSDDLGRESANPIIPAINQDAVTPEIEAVLNAVSTQFSTDDLREMNYAVEFERRELTDVVAEWLRDNGFD